MRFLVSLLILVNAVYAQNTSDMKRTGAEQLQFRDTQIMPLLGMMGAQQLPYPEINKRIAKQEQLIDSRFGGKKTHLILRGFYSPVHPGVSMASTIEENGGPGIIVYLPAIMDAYSQKSFRCTFIRQLLHERDHLTEMIGNPTSVNIENEIHVHALTAEFVLVPLIGKYKATCAQNDINHYNMWVKAGRSEKSPIWRDYIKKLYAPVLGVR